MFAELGAGTRVARLAKYADPAWRQQVRNKLIPVLVGWTDRTTIAIYPPEPALEERNLAEVARERGVDPMDLAFDMALNTDLKARFRTAVLNTDEEAIGEMLHDPNTVLGLSDAGAHASQLCDACFSTHLLSHWVREKGVLTIEQGVRALTSRPAEVFGITDRGRLEVGLPADVVVFDPATIAAAPITRVYDLPAGADRLQSDAIGVDAVIVNGTLLRRNGVDQVDPAGALPGRLLRRGRTAQPGRMAAE